MPGSVARTSTFALNNVTLPFILALADKGWKQALRDDRILASGPQRSRRKNFLRACRAGARSRHGARKLVILKTPGKLRPPAIDRDDLTGDPAGTIACQEQRGRRDVVGRPPVLSNFRYSRRAPTRSGRGTTVSAAAFAAAPFARREAAPAWRRGRRRRFGCRRPVCPIDTEMPNSRHCPSTGANISSKLTCCVTDGRSPPCASCRSPRSAAATRVADRSPQRQRDRACRCAAWQKSPQAAPHCCPPGTGRAMIAQHRVVAGLVGVVEREQRERTSIITPLRSILRGLRRLWLGAAASHGARAWFRSSAAIVRANDIDYGTSSPREGNAGASADATLRKAGRNAGVENHVVGNPRLRDDGSGVLAAERAPVR